MEHDIEQNARVTLIVVEVEQRQLAEKHGNDGARVLDEEQRVGLLQQQHLQQLHVVRAHRARLQRLDLLQHLFAVAELAAERRRVVVHDAHALQQHHARSVRVTRQQPRVQRHEEERGVEEVEGRTRRGHEGGREQLAERRAVEVRGDPGKLGEEVVEEHEVSLVRGVQHHELRVVPARGHLDGVPRRDLLVQTALQLQPLLLAPHQLVGAGGLEVQREERGEVEVLDGEGELPDLLPHEQRGRRLLLRLLRLHRQRPEQARRVGRFQHADELPREGALQEGEEHGVVLRDESEQGARDELERGRGVEERAAQHLEVHARVDGVSLEL